MHAPGELIEYHPIDPTWIHFVHPTHSVVALASFALDPTITIKIEAASGPVWIWSRPTTPGTAPQLIRPPAAWNSDATRRRASEAPAGPRAGPHRPPSRQTLDDLLRALDPTPPVHHQEARMDAHLTACRALGRRADLLAPHRIHAFAGWLEASLCADVSRSAQRRAPTDTQIAMRTVVWMLGDQPRQGAV